jgi:diguanylate cyclase (GGDEF)-like protein
MDQLNKFSHQSAIILSEQLNLILNNLTLKELSYTDGLTKLKNNLYFRKKIDEVCQMSQNAQLVLFDVDFFKKINDSYGHPGGDAVLMFLGEKIPQVMQKVNPDFAHATIARVGGEEFAIIIPDRDLEFANMFAETLRSEIQASTVDFNATPINFTISLGISSWTSKHVFTPEAVKLLYKAADDALYNSKRSGRNRVSVLAAA